MKSSLGHLARRIGRVASSDDTSFSTLVHLAGLNPGDDFREADLAGVDFGSADLTGYDFTNANLTNANLSNVQNIQRAKLIGAKLDGAQLPSEESVEPTLFDAKQELLQLVERMVDACVRALRPALGSKSLKAQVLDRNSQGDLFKAPPEKVVKVRKLLIACPLTISRTAVRQWRDWHPRRRYWLATRIVGTRPVPHIASWLNQDQDEATLLVAPMTFRTRAVVDISNIIFETSMPGPTARMLGEVFYQDFQDALRALGLNNDLIIELRQGNARQFSAIKPNDA